METTQIDVWCIKQEEDEDENKRALQELRCSLDQEEMDTDLRSTEPSEMNLQEGKCASFSNLGQPEEIDIDSISTLCELSKTPVGCASKLNKLQGLNTEFVLRSSVSRSKLSESKALNACPKTDNSRESNPSSVQFKEIETGSALTLSSSISENRNTCDYANDTRQNHDDDESNVYCLICSKDLDSRLHYTFHMKILHHIIIPEAQSETETSIEINDPNYHCSQCKISFTTRSNYHKHLDHSYKMHYLQVHQIHVISITQQKIPYPEIIPNIEDPDFHCAACNETLSNQLVYSMHLYDLHDINPFITYDTESFEEFYDAPFLFEESDSSHSIAQCQLTPDKDDEYQLQHVLINTSNMVSPVEANTNKDRVCLDNSQTETNKKAIIATYCDKCKPSFMSSRFCVKHFLSFPPRTMRQTRKLNRFITPIFHDAQQTNANHDK
ncbi:hypothetical protein BD770DRAFT_475911 [Pilaira anomala]|nr:hypothetical protein BD770DRAFT_475911 [Pilaira anomala]